MEWLGDKRGNLKDITIKDKDGQHIIKAGTQSGNDNNSKPAQDDSTNNGGTVNNQVRNEQQVTGNQYNKNQQAARQSKVTAPSRVKLKYVKNKKGKKIQISLEENHQVINKMPPSGIQCTNRVSGEACENIFVSARLHRRAGHTGGTLYHRT